MSFEQSVFTKDNLDSYLKELAKEYKKRNRSALPAEIILIGGASVLANYGFRDMTTDIDAVILAASSMKEAINCIRDRYGLRSGWLNADFMCTESYSSKLVEVSVYYKTFLHVLEIRTVSAEYLVAMKLRAGRKYKNDLSDVIGILAEHEKRGRSITRDSMDRAVEKLYGGWAEIPEDSKQFLADTMKMGNYAEVYAKIRQEEKESKKILLQFAKDYPGAANESNVNAILKTLKSKQKESHDKDIEIK